MSLGELLSITVFTNLPIVLLIVGHIKPCFDECHFMLYALLFLQWMIDMWKTDPCYGSHGVNGTLCSILIYLSEVPKLLSLSQIIPTQDHFMYIGNQEIEIVCIFGVCTAATARSLCWCCVKVESWCPVLPGRVIPSAAKQNSEVKTKAKEEIYICGVRWGVVFTNLLYQKCFSLLPKRTMPFFQGKLKITAGNVYYISL